MKRHLFIGVFILIIAYFFSPFLIQKRLPIPADTIIGLYHPFRDLYAVQSPRGVPFKNSLITDPVRQQYPWRYLSILLEKNLQLPLWNPYTFAGQPLLGNQQSAPLYPLNFIFFIIPFPFAWSLLIFLSPLLGGIFLYCYLKNLKLDPRACLFGSITLAFSGFYVAWLEWGTITNTALWLPLILLSIDKLIEINALNSKIAISKKTILWRLMLIFSLASSLLAGHLQTFFYVYILSSIYFLVRWIYSKRDKRLFFLFLIFNICFLILTAIQWIPVLGFINLSARNVDQSWLADGWFIPWQNIIQFIIPDFFGNPATGNYWGVWNYGEFVGYIGILPLILSMFALFYRKDRKTLFFGIIFFTSLLFSFPTVFAKLPYILNIPFISTSQPTRLIFLTDFSLAILAALGLDYSLKKSRNIVYPIIFIALVLLSLWLFVNYSHSSDIVNLHVAKSNIVFPAVIFVISAIIVLYLSLAKQARFKFVQPLLYLILLGFTIFDVTRFAQKFTPFTPESYLYPSTSSLTFIQQNIGINRIMATDKRLLPPNFSIMYKLQSIDGYDPLYLLRYGELIAASERKKPDISSPFGFNRIITPENYESRIIDLLGVKYVLSLQDIKNDKLEKIFQEGETRVYQNLDVLPRIFFIYSAITESNKLNIINDMFNSDIDLRTTAIVEGFDHIGKYSLGSIKNINYRENSVSFDTEDTEDGFLVLTDNYYPTWHVKVDNLEGKIYRTDYSFRGILVPKGIHHIVFYDSLF